VKISGILGNGKWEAIIGVGTLGRGGTGVIRKDMVLKLRVGRIEGFNDWPRPNNA
jgi:hypothetical protein